jgi:hypothetical protein
MRKPNIGLKDSRPPPVPALYFFEDTPDVIVLHVAGNDLGAYEIGDLRYFLRAQLRYIKRNYPNTKLIWSR